MATKKHIHLELTDNQLALLTQALKTAKQDDFENGNYVSKEDELAINLILLQLPSIH